MLINDKYYNRIERNIGHTTSKEQEFIRASKIAIMGVGGLGGPLVDQLARIGCQNLILCDNDRYDESNLNRQLCTTKDIGMYKVDHLRKHLLNIDPEISILNYKNVRSSNIDTILHEVKVLCLSLDDPITSVIIARKCREKGIPMVESWGVPYLWAWWFTSKSIDYESCYEMNTKNISLEDLETLYLEGYRELLPKLVQFPGFREIYDREHGYFEKMKNGVIPYRSFAPFVHLTASYLAIEVIFAGLLKVKKKILAPNIVGYDYIRMKELRFTMN
ncbi:MAG: ThiF family adenylyltransferase [Promethearchaeota archaeon]|nr:MAG: ThiF family adenylyltransferase [Candidatus Lokiarchaeota archaeon]